MLTLGLAKSTLAFNDSKTVSPTSLLISFEFSGVVLVSLLVVILKDFFELTFSPPAISKARTLRDSMSLSTSVAGLTLETPKTRRKVLTAVPDCISGKPLTRMRPRNSITLKSLTLAWERALAQFLASSLSKKNLFPPFTQISPCLTSTTRSRSIKENLGKNQETFN